MENGSYNPDRLAHDFKNIIAVIKLYAQLGLRDPSASEPIRDDLKVILDQASEAIRLMEDLQQASKAGKDILNNISIKHTGPGNNDIRDRLQVLLSNLPGFAYRCKNAPGWPMEFISEGFLELTGYEAGEFRKGNYFEYEKLIHPDDRNYVAETVQECNSKGQPFTIEYRIVAKDGTEKKVWERGRQVVSVDDPLGQLEGFIMDITNLKKAEADKKQLEEQLIQARKMEIVGKLAGGVAHEFNNTLQVINTLAELSLLKLEKDHEITVHLEQILASVRQSSGFVGQLLALARKQAVNPEVINLDDFIEGMIVMLQRLVGANIELKWHPQDELWPVNIDPAQVTQVLINLTLNARDAIEGPGTITVSVSNEIVEDIVTPGNDERKTGDYVMLTMTDSGCGMDESVISKIYEPFFTTKPSGKGTGLGLSTVYGIVSQNNGFISVDSRPGEGTTFRVYFPRHE